MVWTVGKSQDDATRKNPKHFGSFNNYKGLFGYPPHPSPTDKIIIPPPIADAQLSSMVEVSV